MSQKPFLAYIQPISDGHPDQGLPGRPPPVDPGWGQGRPLPPHVGGGPVYPGGPVDPGYGQGWLPTYPGQPLPPFPGRPDQGLPGGGPVDPGYGQGWVPTYPGQPLPPFPGRPGQGLPPTGDGKPPGWGGLPDQGLPGKPPGYWGGGGVPMPVPPIVIPPENVPPEVEVPPNKSLVIVFIPGKGWEVVLVDTPPGGNTKPPEEGSAEPK